MSATPRPISSAAYPLTVHVCIANLHCWLGPSLSSTCYFQTVELIFANIFLYHCDGCDRCSSQCFHERGCTILACLFMEISTLSLTHGLLEASASLLPAAEVYRMVSRVREENYSLEKSIAAACRTSTTCYNLFGCFIAGRRAGSLSGFRAALLPWPDRVKASWWVRSSSC